MKSVVSERGQMVIPKPLRDRLGLRPGQIVDCREDRGRLVVVKAASSDPLEAVWGILRGHRTPDQLIEELRGSAKPEPQQRRPRKTRGGRR